MKMYKRIEIEWNLSVHNCHNSLSALNGTNQYVGIRKEIDINCTYLTSHVKLLHFIKYSLIIITILCVFFLFPCCLLV